jgi:hypothetical protein
MKVEVICKKQAELQVGDVIDVEGEQMIHDLRLVIEADEKFNVISLADGRAVFGSYKSLEDIWKYYKTYHKPKILKITKMLLEEK